MSNSVYREVNARASDARALPVRAIRLPPGSNGRPLWYHLRQFMRLAAAGWRALSKSISPAAFDGRERVTNFVRDARRQMPHRHQLFFTLHCIKAVLCASADNADAKNASNVANSTPLTPDKTISVLRRSLPVSRPARWRPEQ